MWNYAIIGCGSIVEDLHMPALRALPGVKLEAVCDVNHEQLAAFGKRHGISRLYDDIDGFMAECRNLDFVLIATPGFTHFDICRRLMEAGLNVLVEKPVTLSLQETLSLRDLAAKKNIKAGVIQNYRYRDNVLKARADMEKGLVGVVKQVNVVCHGQSLFNFPAPWSWDEPKCKTLVYEICLHYLDLETLFAGRVSRLIGGRAFFDKILNCTERVYALVEHENGAIGSIDLQFNSSSNYTHVEVFGSANDIRLKFFPEYYRIYSGNVNPIDEVGFDLKRIMDFALPSIWEKFSKPKVKRRAQSHFRLIKAYVDAIKGEREQVPVSLEDVVPTMELAEELSKFTYCCTVD
jgi:predicted dehydrogenase